MAKMEDLRTGDFVLYRAACKTHTDALENAVCVVTSERIEDNVRVEPIPLLSGPKATKMYVYPENLIKIDLPPQE